MAEKNDLALSAAKMALKAAAGSSSEEGDAPRASWKKKLLAGGAGLAAAFYIVNSFIGIVPLLNHLHYIFALGVIFWSMSVWGVKPLAMMKARKERKRLEAEHRGDG